MKLTPPYSSWTHKLARVVVRPLVGGVVTPNHLTTLRLVTGVAACAAFIVGNTRADFWGGVLWIISCFLDRADGELARIGKMSSPSGHLYDYYCDIGVNALFFLAIGIGLRDSAFGHWAIVMGVLSCIGVAAASILSEHLEIKEDSGVKAYSGVLGFDFDDVLYLFSFVGWFGLFFYLLIGAAVGAPFFALLTWRRLVVAKS